jgi:streptogramin lyase
MAATRLKANAVAAIAAAATAGSAPSASDLGFSSGEFAVVRTFVTYAGAVTAAVIRCYVQPAGSTAWFRGASSADIGPLAPTTGGKEALDWIIGKGHRVFFVLESITPSAGAPTVAVDVAGVEGVFGE